MPNGHHGIKKDTYVNADEETQRALTYDLIDGIYGVLEEVKEETKVRVDGCNKHFKKLDNGKIKDGGLAALFGTAAGFIAGLIK